MRDLVKRVSSDVGEETKMQHRILRSLSSFALAILLPSTFLFLAGCSEDKTERFKRPDPWEHRDREAECQTVRFGKTLVRVPTKYIYVIQDAFVRPEGRITQPRVVLRAPPPGWKKGEYRDPSDYLFIKVAHTYKKRPYSPEWSEMEYLTEFSNNRKHRFVEYDPVLGMNVYQPWSSYRKDYIPNEFRYIPQSHRRTDGRYIVITCSIDNRLSYGGTCSAGTGLSENAYVSFRFVPGRLKQWDEIYQFVDETVKLIPVKED